MSINKRVTPNYITSTHTVSGNERESQGITERITAKNHNERIAMRITLKNHTENDAE